MLSQEVVQAQEQTAEIKGTLKTYIGIAPFSTLKKRVLAVETALASVSGDTVTQAELTSAVGTLQAADIAIGISISQQITLTNSLDARISALENA